MQEKRGKGIVPARLVTFQPIAGVVVECFCAKTVILASAVAQAPGEAVTRKGNLPDRNVAGPQLTDRNVLPL
jgi:hypothetical protein